MSCHQCNIVLIGPSAHTHAQMQTVATVRHKGEGHRNKPTFDQRGGQQPYSSKCINANKTRQFNISFKIVFHNIVGGVLAMANPTISDTHSHGGTLKFAEIESP